MDSSEILSPLRDRAVSVLGGKSQVFAEILLETDNEEQYTRGYSPQEGNAITGLVYNEDECLILRAGFLERHLENAEETTEKTVLHESKLFREGSYFTFDTKTPAGPDQRERIQLLDNARKAIVGENEVDKTIIGEEGFSSGFHCWTLECSPLSEIAVGITSLVGVSTLADASPIVLLKKQSDNRSYKFFSQRQSGLPDEVDDLIAPIADNETNIVSVSIDFTSKLITFFVDATLIGIIPVSELAGSQTLYCSLRSGSSVVLIHELPCCYLPLVNVSSTLLASSDLSHRVRSPMLSSDIIAGNPYSRWGSNPGFGIDSTFTFPLGLVHDGNGNYFIGDRNVIRVLNTKQNPPTVSNQVVYYISNAAAKEVLVADFINVLYYDEIEGEGILTIFDNENQSLLDVKISDWTISKEYDLTEFFNDQQSGSVLCDILNEIRTYDVANGCFGTTIASTHRSIELVRSSSDDLNSGMFCFGVQGFAKIGEWCFVTIPSLALLVAVPPSGKPYPILGVRETRGYNFGWGSSCLLHSPTSIVSFVDKMQKDHHLFITDTGNNSIVNVRLRFFDGTYDAHATPFTIKVSLEGSGFTITELSIPYGVQLTTEVTGHFLVVAEVEYQRIWKIGPLQITAAETTEADLWQYFGKWMLEDVVTNSLLRCDSFSSYISSSGVLHDCESRSRIESFFIDLIESADRQQQYQFLSSLKQYICDGIDLPEDTLSIIDSCD